MFEENYNLVDKVSELIQKLPQGLIENVYYTINGMVLSYQAEEKEENKKCPFNDKLNRQKI